MGKKIFYCGDSGSGLVAKLTNNMIAISTTAILSEIITIGLKQGLDLPLQLKVYDAGTASSWLVKHWDEFTRLRRSPAFVEIMYKDIGLGLELAQESGITMPIISMCSEYDFYVRE
jgi:3-hydroxyisobutyrate dehydrogenase-like beta-hydroxyacid dehydrogenase